MCTKKLIVKKNKLSSKQKKFQIQNKPVSELQIYAASLS